MEWVFGYASLLAAHVTEPARVVACALRDHRRRWGVAMDNSVDLPAYKHYVRPDGTRPDAMVCFLDAEHCPGEAVNGVCVPVEGDELERLDRRERNYDRTDVTGLVQGAPEGRIWTYTGSADARERRERGMREGSLVVSRTYLERVRMAFKLRGEHEAFARSTDPVPCSVEDLVVVRAPGSANPH